MVVFFLVFLSGSVFARDIIETRVEPVVDVIYDDGQQRAMFNVYVTNNAAKETAQVYLSEIIDVKWNVEVLPPIYTKGFSLDPGETKKATYYIKPALDDIGTTYLTSHNLTVVLSSSIEEERHSLGLVFEVKSAEPIVREWLPSINYDVDVRPSSDPRKKSYITVTLINRNVLNITDMTVDIDTTVNPENNVEDVFVLGPLKKAEKTYALEYDPLQPPVVDQIIVKISIPSKNWTYAPVSRQVVIEGYYDIHEESEVVEDRFLKKTEVMRFKNDGTLRFTKNVTYPINYLTQVLSSTDPKAEVVFIDGERHYQWRMSLGPQDQAEFSVTTNYRPLVAIIVLVLVGIILYYVFRSPLVVRKESHEMIIKEHDDQIGFKILVHIKNRTNSIIDNIKIVDHTPPFVKVSNKFTLGTLQPDKMISHQKKGTLLKWSIETLEPFEERIISYEITPKLKVIGSVRLGSVRVKYKTRFGRIARIYSNKLILKEIRGEPVPRKKKQ